jgi:hypothetical protein
VWIKNGHENVKAKQLDKGRQFLTSRDYMVDAIH